MGFTITKSSESPVRPAEQTPSGTLLLSWLDRYPTHRGLVESLHVFKEGREPGKVIREAMAKALVPYYPLAGRIVEPEGMEPRIECTGEGVWFVDASADCSLEDVNYLERPLLIAQEDLVPYTKLEIEPADTIMMVQVTEFTCGGFVVGLRFNHASADGLGAAQFINAVGEIARGLPEPTVKPVWNREAFPNPKIKPGPLPDLPNLALEYSAVDFPLDYINQLKNRFMEHTGRRCSTFDVLTAKAWQCRTKALKLAPDVNVRLCFFASVRHILKLDRGYYGNCIFPVKMMVPSGKVIRSSLVEVVDLIRDAKERMAAEVLAWANGDVEGDPFSMTFNYESIYVSDWTKLGFSEVDYGWGTPMYAGPLTNNDFIASLILLKSPAPLEGARMMTRCVSTEHVEAFNELIMNLD
ncbi:acyl transferase 9 [Elaeis guineensis]|uniref:acyl transferase 9 n=1 Tax=Elaeis guineensis var. tenera TaxID=51953 RepID=UPI003C6D80BE